ncbi:hypothetical protein DFR70_1011080 [Nocardia tenerifensis]|uniref:Uncharacterized protein n=1 Tax=Nocardia tenerifensis TaxID=228006 RepID=A0A318KBZ7_9NOCA|nr:hypothetical protein [Nocardia tenerifensis]PXX71646.1 hypothetical protein DFR70_1011080 [Nocardia tenerifensis]
MAENNTYSLYAWGNFLDETGLDRLDAWLDPDVLSGARLFENPDVTLYEEQLRIDASSSYYFVGGEYVLGRDLAEPCADWRAAYLCLATDGTLDGALEVVAQFEDEWDRDDTPTRNPLPAGEVVTVWEDPHGQWDLALVRN